MSKFQWNVTAVTGAWSRNSAALDKGSTGQGGSGGPIISMNTHFEMIDKFNTGGTY